MTGPSIGKVRGYYRYDPNGQGDTVSSGTIYNYAGCGERGGRKGTWWIAGRALAGRGGFKTRPYRRCAFPITLPSRMGWSFSIALPDGDAGCGTICTRGWIGDVVDRMPGIGR